MKTTFRIFQGSIFPCLAFAFASVVALQTHQAGPLTMLTNFGPPRGPAATEFVDVNGTLFFRTGTQLWKSNGTAAGTDGFILEQADTLSATTSWLPSNVPIAGNGHRRSVTLPMTRSAQFFRIRRQHIIF